MVLAVIRSLWLALLAYWLISARRVKATKYAERPARALARTALTIFVFILMFSSLGKTGWLGKRIVPSVASVAVCGALLTALGVGLAAWARYVLGNNWSAAITLKESHELVFCGPYAWIRHPIYVGVVMGVFGTALTIGEWRGVVACLVLLVSWLVKAGREEKLLVREFGAAFEEYRSRTGMFVPRFH